MDAFRSRAITDAAQLQSLDRPRAAPLSLEALFHTRQIGGADWAPDGRQIVFTANLSGRQNLWLVPVREPGAHASGAGTGWPVQLTISDQRQASPSWSPDGRWIAFISDHNGDEQWDLFLVSPLTGEVVNLTNTPDIAEQSPTWSPDGRRLAYIAKPREGSSFEVRVVEVAANVASPRGGQSRPITHGTPPDYGCYDPIWSPAGDAIAYTREHATGRNSDVCLASLEGGQPRNLTAHAGEQIFSAADWAPAGDRLLISSNVRNGFDNVAELEIASGRLAWLTETEWETQAGGFSRDGRWLTFGTNVDGETAIWLHDRQRGRARELALPGGVNFPEGANGGFDRDAGRLLFAHNGPDGPNDLWVYSLAGEGSFPLTRSLVGGLRGEVMVAPVLAHLPSRDGLQISAWVYVPHGIVRDGTHPAVVYIHGGPAAQAMNAFNRAVQLLVNRGYVVIAPNYRGSTGYGKAFHEANRFDLGGGDLADVVNAADWLGASGFVDQNKMIAMGGSYGGYLTAMALTRHPERWAAGVAIVPFVNWFTEIANEDPLLREYDLATMGNPEENRALFEERSPIYHIDQIRAPILLLAGGQDPRCPRGEAEQAAAAVRARGGVAELKIYEDEGHGFARVENQVDAYRRVEAFLLRHVPPPGAPSVH